MNSRILDIASKDCCMPRVRDVEKSIIELLEEEDKDFRWKKTAILAIMFLTILDNHGVFYGYAYRLGERILNLPNNTEKILKFLVEYFSETEISEQAKSLLEYDSSSQCIYDYEPDTSKKGGRNGNTRISRRSPSRRPVS